MLTVGETVFHATHGVGTVQEIEKKEILGQKMEFAVLHFPEENLELMLKLNGSTEELRPVMDREEAEETLEYLSDWDGKLAANWKKRRRANKERIYSGEVEQLCHVLKGLAKLSKRRDLTKGDQRQYDRSLNLLSQELAHSLGCSREDAEARIEGSLERSLEEESQPAA